MGIIYDIFGFGKSDKDREVEGFLEKQRLEHKITQDTDEKHDKLYAQLTNEEAKKINNMKSPMIFSCRSEFVDWQNMEMKILIKQRGKK